MPETKLQTEWRIRGVPGHSSLDVRLTVDTTAPIVVKAIEQAAKERGLTLLRVTQLPDAKPPSGRSKKTRFHYKDVGKEGMR